MSATDDAHPRNASGRTRGSAAGVLALAAILPGALFGAAMLTLPDFLPSIPRYECVIPWRGPAPTLASETWSGERVALVNGGSALSARAPGASAARALAERLALARNTGSAPAGRRERLRADLVPRDVAPLPALAPATECAVLLRARAAVGRALAGDGSVGGNEDVSNALPASLAEADRAVEQAALALDPATLRTALAGADRAEAAWLGTLARTQRAGMFQRWRERERARAAEFDDAASVLLEEVTGFQRELAGWWLPEMTLQLESRAPDAASAIALASSASLPEPRPWWPAWLAAALCGALLASAGTFALALSRPMRHSENPVRRALPQTTNAWLHIVSGREPGHIVRGMQDLAAHLIGRSERILLIDGARRLQLHEELNVDGRFGLADCLAGEMPLLAAAQPIVGNPGLFVLAHGEAARGERWSALGRVLEEARPHFGRVLLAIDAAAPHAAGDALMGRVLEGWWAGSGSGLPRLALALAERTGISFTSLTLLESSDALHETRSERLQVLRPADVTPQMLPLTSPAGAPVMATAAAPSEDIVLDCDLHVRQRLRFLFWMRRIQAESQREAVTPASRP
jgi:hypothetical protein